MLYYEYAPDPYVPVDLQAMQPAGQCSICEGELFSGQCCYRIEGALVCEDCLSYYARAYFRGCRVRIRSLRQP